MRTVGVDLRVLGTGRMSGIEEYTHQVVAHMTALTSEVQWKMFYSGRRPLVRHSWMEKPSVRIYEFRRSNRLLSLKSRITGRPHLDSLVGGTDVFFFPHFVFGALSDRCRRVMTWHDMSYERMPYLLSPYRRFWHAVQMRPRSQAILADRIIAVSSATAADITERYRISSDKISIVHSGIDPHLRRASETEIQKWRKKRAMLYPYVLAVGTREPRKNLPALIKAWDIVTGERELEEIHLVLVGQSGWNEADIRRAINASRAPQMIHIIENIDLTERPMLYSAASVLVYPSLMEGFGFPPLEAMACGTPVIASATSSLIEIVQDAGLLVDPYRIVSLTDALRSVLTDMGLRERLVLRGYERARTFSWQRAAQSTLNAILSVL